MTKKPKKHQVQIDPETYRRLAVVAAWAGVSVPDWVNNQLSPLIDAAFPLAVEQMLGPEPKKKPTKKDD